VEKGLTGRWHCCSKEPVVSGSRQQKETLSVLCTEVAAEKKCDGVSKGHRSGQRWNLILTLDELRTFIYFSRVPSCLRSQRSCEPQDAFGDLE
jgi:hypothetical protein